MGLALLAGPASAVEPPPEPEGYRMEDYRKPVPATLKGAKVLPDADAARALRNERGAIFLDVYPRAPKPANLPVTTVWREPPHRSIDGAIWLPNVGYGVLSDDMKAYLATGLSTLTGGDLDKPVVFFCLRDCWMSWNAAKRALEQGYRQVYWFPEGTDAWEENGYPVTNVTPWAPAKP